MTVNASLVILEGYESSQHDINFFFYWYIWWTDGRKKGN